MLGVEILKNSGAAKLFIDEADKAKVKVVCSFAGGGQFHEGSLPVQFMKPL